MMGRFSVELLVVVFAMAFFYLRIAMLRGKKKRYEKEYALKRRKVKGRSKGAALPARTPGSSPYIVRSWPLVILSILIILAGFAAYSKFNVFGIELIKDPAIVETYMKYWYLAVSAGVILLSLCITIPKPIIEEDD